MIGSGNRMGNNHANYYGLIFDCPIGKESVKCCYKRIRQLDFKDKLTYYNALTDQEKTVLVKNHQQCLLVREKQTLFHESQ
jgi:hypothetical protein